ncbi:Integrase, catalytic core [Corchorus olitorius]|uniref:Integrase, catalytic core n=1 Tax=Corchorus olitorius TaxID=93759 RepID=A0A1R3JIK4_9ROSI|nr:Integrase, catalytic core [Corchorus olitorius]
MGGRSLAQKVMRLGCYWPCMRKDAVELVRKCEKCQLFAKVPRMPAEELNVIKASWPFTMWGVDNIGPFPEATGKRKYAIVACDYFTKWVEAEPMASITKYAVKHFLWQNRLCRFGVPNVFISDNGRQLQAEHIHNFCAKYHIKMIASSVDHPQTNRLASYGESGPPVTQAQERPYSTSPSEQKQSSRRK